MENLSFLKEVINKHEIDESEKRLVRSICKEVGVAVSFATKCKTKWQDSVLEAYNILKEREVAENSEQDENAEIKTFVLRAGVDVFFRNIRINEATMTDELARDILKKGFPKRFFTKLGD